MSYYRYLPTKQISILILIESLKKKLKKAFKLIVYGRKECY